MTGFMYMYICMYNVDLLDMYSICTYAGSLYYLFIEKWTAEGEVKTSLDDKSRSQSHYMYSNGSGQMV